MWDHMYIIMFSNFITNYFNQVIIKQLDNFTTQYKKTSIFK